jgi:glycosyltransferase involved in cell wall biosynthesis
MHARADVTVVIAALNEAPTIADIVTRCRQYAAEVIAVDGHSDDGTARLAAAAGAKVLADNRKGKGDALRVAIPHVTTMVTVFVDADGSHDPDDIPKLVLPIVNGAADHVTGSRLIGGSSELHGGFDEFFRLAGSSFITACLNWKFAVRLSDSQNGFRAIRTEVLRELDLSENTTTVEQEMIIETLRRGYRMAEVPTHEYCRRFGTSHIRVWRAAPRYVASLMRGLIGGTRRPQAAAQSATGESPLKTPLR